MRQSIWGTNNFQKNPHFQKKIKHKPLGHTRKGKNKNFNLIIAYLAVISGGMMTLKGSFSSDISSSLNYCQN